MERRTSARLKAKQVSQCIPNIFAHCVLHI
jgi:hypothetical protein